MTRNKNVEALKEGVSMERSRARLLVAAAGLFAVLLTIFYFYRSGPIERVSRKPVTLPDFSKVVDIAERKKAFFDFLVPFIESSNREVLRLREEVLDLQEVFEKKGALSNRELDRLREIELSYKFNPDDGVDALTFRDVLARVDIIPPSLALAQAALESAWGTSRFATKGNNLYGIWCYEPGCGMIPRRRPAGKTYEVQSFSNPRECFDAYIYNLNTNSVYGSMRAIRRALRRSDATITGYELAVGMTRYSQEGYVYVGKVQSLISSNRLAEYDK